MFMKERRGDKDADDLLSVNYMEASESRLGMI